MVRTPRGHGGKIGESLPAAPRLHAHCEGQRLRGRHLALDGEQLPLVGHAFQAVQPMVDEGDSRAGHQVFDRPGYQGLSWASERLDPGRDVHGEATHILAASLDLAGVQSATELDA